MPARGYTFFVVSMYLFVFGLFISLAITVWIGVCFLANRFTVVW